MENKVAIKIPRELYLKLSSMIAGTGFSSVTDFTTFVMRSLASGGDLMGEDNLTAEETKAVREQLCKLLYQGDDRLLARRRELLERPCRGFQCIC